MKIFLKIAIIIIIIPLFITLAIASYIFIPINKQMKDINLKAGGYIAGVCHPDFTLEGIDSLKGANLNWIRTDIPYPYDNEGNLSSSYISFKDRVALMSDNGIKVMAITPYPKDYIDDGADPRTEAGSQKVVEIARFLIEDLKDYVSGIQITNEMGLAHFTQPLTMKEAVHFIAIQLEGINDVKGDIIVGFNSAGLNLDLYGPLIPYAKYCDYIGIDIYEGAFWHGSFEMFYAILHILHGMFKKPIIVQEFGYMSSGNQKSNDEKLTILNSYGFSSEAEARADIELLVSRLDPMFRNTLTMGYPDSKDWEYALFETANVLHFYEEIPYQIEGYSHTPEGQAAYYSKIIKDLRKINFLAGFFIYCYSDAPLCYHCGSDTCPVETSWGLVDNERNPKPSYNAVRDALQ